MFLKTYKPVTSGLRHRFSLSSFFLNDKKFNRLLVGFKKNSGRSRCGKITVFSKASRNTRYISIDFKRRLFDWKAMVLNVIRDCNRSCFASLIKYSNGGYSYVLSTHGVANGSIIRSYLYPEIGNIMYTVGCCTILKNLLPGSVLSNVEVVEGIGGTIARAAGTYCLLLSKNKTNGTCRIKIPSGNIIVISWFCLSTLGRNANIWYYKRIIGKAGRNINMGLRPSVRGVAMNPVDHPHGGRTKTNRPEVTPWGKIAKFNK